MPGNSPMNASTQHRGRAVFDRLVRVSKQVRHAARMLVGMPDYDVYVQHMQQRHPEVPVMSYEAFFRERQEARYGGGKGRPIRCC